MAYTVFLAHQILLPIFFFFFFHLASRITRFADNCLSARVSQPVAHFTLLNLYGACQLVMGMPALVMLAIAI